MSERGMIEVCRFNATSSQPNVLVGSLRNFKICISTLPEQTKIANFLTAVDERIAQLTQKGELLARYKKGVMQQIFSQQLRFKDDDGRDFPEWDFLELEKIAFKVNSKNKDFAISNVLTNSATQGIVNQANYFDRDIANQNNLGGYYIVEINDFVYNPRISSNALVGPIKRNKLITGVMSPLYTVFRFKEGILSFFEQYFETTHWHDYMKSVSNSGARYDRMNITNESFFSLPIPYPSLPEQTKIANFLTALDDKINLNQAQLDAVKKYKQGLLQQMFV
jgi:type I restriction enzyme S subunit